MDKTVAVEVSNITKKFTVSKKKQNSIKSAIVQFHKSQNDKEDRFTVLNDVSFKIEKGDFFGILGRNGSGKSTLLKIIAGIYMPTSGTVRYDGKIVAFIELGVGFKPDLTGRENVYLNGALLGFSKNEIDEIYDEIVEFAELEEFMDQKLKNYSSGMQVRLAFSVAIRANADILILDEVLAVGDAAFQKKCNDYFELIRNEGKTVILVTHNMGNVRRFCNKALLLEAGRVRSVGESDEIAKEYTALLNSEKKPPTMKDREQPVAGEYVRFLPATIKQDDKQTGDIEAFNDFTIEVPVELKKVSRYAKMFNVGVIIRGRNNIKVFSTDYSNVNKRDYIDVSALKTLTVSFTVEENILTDGKYTVDAYYSYYNNKHERMSIDLNKNAAEFSIKGVAVHKESLVHLETSARIL